MDVLFIVVIGVLLGFGTIIYWCLEKISNPKKKFYLSCRECGKELERKDFTTEELPFEFEGYLNKWNLPEEVIRRHICPDGHNQVWIAPPMGDMEWGLKVWR